MREADDLDSWISNPCERRSGYSTPLKARCGFIPTPPSTSAPGNPRPNLVARAEAKGQQHRSHNSTSFRSSNSSNRSSSSNSSNSSIRSNSSGRNSASAHFTSDQSLTSLERQNLERQRRRRRVLSEVFQRQRTAEEQAEEQAREMGSPISDSQHDAASEMQLRVVRMNRHACAGVRSLLLMTETSASDESRDGTRGLAQPSMNTDEEQEET